MVGLFEKVPGNKIVLRKGLYYNYTGDSTLPMYKAVIRASFLPIIASFNIESYTPDSMGVVINVTDYLLGDNELFSFGNQKNAYALASLAADKSYINSIKDFPANIEISTVKTFLQGGGSLSNRYIENVSFELNTSIILLPSTPARQRFSDARVGYFPVSEIDYNTNLNGVKVRSYIQRWRLEPSQEDAENYKRGILVNPLHPIVFYIDPATPKKWVPYLEEGVNDWQKAFEQAGFKNAIIAKLAPAKKEDSTWNLFDARHSAIVYKPSSIENAAGNRIVDPRTGEILESHIDWYHNIMELIHNWYMVQCGAVDEKARKMIFDDSLMGKLIRIVCSHEVGHALGLTHNMGSSSTVPVDSLRSKTWVEANGICPSIMDYARYNYVAQPEDHISEKGLFPRIGVYDNWAIEWGYRWLPQYKNPEEETHYLNEWIIEKNKDKRLWFGSEHSWDPRCQTEDIGNDPIKASGYGIKNLKRILPRLIEWANMPDEGYANLNGIYDVVQSQFEIYLGHVVRTIGGMHETLKSVEQAGPVYQPVSAKYQRSAVDFLNKNIFQTPYWLADTLILNRTGQSALGVIGSIQNQILMNLLSTISVRQMYSSIQSNNKNKTVYTFSELLGDLKKYIWGELDTHSSISIFRQNLQMLYMKNLLRQQLIGIGINTEIFITLPISGKTPLEGSEVMAITEGNLKEIAKSIQKDLPFVKDKSTRYHLQYIYDKIAHLHESRTVSQ
jgi:hypothetical protein